MRSIWLFILCSFAATTIQASAEQIEYFVTPVLSAEKPHIRVQIKYHPKSFRAVEFGYFDKIWGQSDMFNCVTDFAVDNPQAKLELLPEQDKIIISNHGNSPFIIEYKIIQDFTGKIAPNQYYRPIIQQDYFHLFGHRLFMLPSHFMSNKRKHRVKLIFNSEYNNIFHNLGDGDGNVFELNKNEILESIIVGGDFRQINHQDEHVRLKLLVRGHWENFSDDELIGQVAKMSEILRNFWNDQSEEMFTITLLPLAYSKVTHLGGTGLMKGFASYCTNSRSVNLENIRSLYFHEFIHHWIGGKIRNTTLTEELWFIEGFTEYLSTFLMFKNGMISKKDFNVMINKVFREHRNSQFSEIPNNQIQYSDFVRTCEIEKIPYNRGFIYACYLENLFVEKASKFSILLNRILQDCQKYNMQFSNAYFKSLLKEYFGNEEVENFNKFIIEGKNIPLKAFEGDYSSNRVGKIIYSNK